MQVRMTLTPYQSFEGWSGSRGSVDDQPLLKMGAAAAGPVLRSHAAKPCSGWRRRTRRLRARSGRWRG